MSSCSNELNMGKTLRSAINNKGYENWFSQNFAGGKVLNERALLKIRKICESLGMSIKLK